MVFSSSSMAQNGFKLPLKSLMAQSVKLVYNIKEPKNDLKSEQCERYYDVLMLLTG